MDALDVIKRLPALLGQGGDSKESPSSFAIARYPWRPSREKTLAGSSESLRRLFGDAGELRKSVGPTLTKQQSLDLACAREHDQTVVDAMVPDLLKHGGEREPILCPIPRLGEILDREVATCPVETGFLSISSRCELQGGFVAHLPMMDLACPPAPHAERWVRTAIKELAPTCPWALLDSGGSYHYYGAELLQPANWQIFLANWLLVSPFVDTRYVGHAYLDGACALRFTGSRSGSGAPKVVASFRFFD